MQEAYNLIVILGPTASGKTSLAAHLAHTMGDAEIISADSRQLYRGMDIGTGKDLADYTVNNTAIPYHLIDIAPAGARLNLYNYIDAFRQTYTDIRSRGGRAILCGGTGLYIEAVIKNYRMMHVPQNDALRQQLAHTPLEELARMLGEQTTLHNTTDTADRAHALRALEIAHYYRTHPAAEQEGMPLQCLVIGTMVDRDTRRSRISTRLHERIAQGMIEEVEQLLKTVSADDLIYYGLEYKYLTLYLTGQLTREEMIQQLEIAIHQFAKRQMTWFRGMERRGIPIHWIDAQLPMEEKVKVILEMCV